jgi:uncharacterized protein (TIGR03437 family)
MPETAAVDHPSSVEPMHIMDFRQIPRLPSLSRKMKTFVIRCVFASFAASFAFAQTPLNSAPTRVLGSLRPNQLNANPNLVEGRELFQPTWIALDSSASPPILYVSDTGNNRVLAWRNAAEAQNGRRADLVIGQRDLESTTALGPGTSLSTGLAAPSGLAIDAEGNLWVADSGNNRVLRFPRPFSQPAQDFPIPDRVIGQVNFNSRAANGGSTTGPTATGINTVTTAGVFQTGLMFDSAQNLWVSDPNNHRILRFPASSLNASNPSSDLVIGQSEFNTRLTSTSRIGKVNLNFPSGMAMDSAGRLFVADNLSRVMVYFPPFRNGLEATRIAGLVVTGGNQQPPPATPVNERALGVTGVGSTLIPPECVFVVGNSLTVVDRAANRIVQYPPVEQWTVEEFLFSPRMTTVIGQNDFTQFRAWGGSMTPVGTGFNLPVGAASSAGGAELYVADTGSHRVLRLSGPPSFRTPVQVFGQDNFEQAAPNLIEGREFHFFRGFSTVSGSSARFGEGVGMAFDEDRLYVADPLNNRVLGFRDARRLLNGERADIVIGQDDFGRNILNAPSGNVNLLTDISLFSPASVAVDANGDLYVADSGNSRVLRFPKPFEQPPGTRHRANLVIGQAGFTTKITDASARNMARPFGLAFTGDGSLLVSDSIHNRVLFFPRPPGGDFTSGQAATIVFGQPDFISSATSNDPRRLFSPRGISVDTDDRLYVADTGRARVAIYDRAPAAGVDPAPAFSIGSISSPHGVYVSPRTGEIWVADTINNRCQRYPLFNQLTQNPNPNFTVPANAPLGVAQDRFGNLFVADAANRIAIHFPTIGLTNAANFLSTTTRNLAPNTYLSIFGSPTAPFSGETTSFSTVPMPKELADVQVTLAEKALPLHFVAPTQINALITNDAPTSGLAEVLVSRVSTGQILASGTVSMGPVAPGLFTAAANGTGQIAALNQDNSINGPANPAPRGSIIQVFGTGPGVIAGSPPDGDVPGGPVPGPNPEVIIGTGLVPSDSIQYSGLAPGLIGVWQINVRIPDNVAPSPTVPFVVRLNSIPNNQLPQLTTIAVRQQ